MEFLFMLTKDDATVPHALEAYEELRGLEELRYVGFKDVGLPTEALRGLVEAIHADGRSAMLEVVSEDADGEVRSVEVGLDIGVDWLLGGTQVQRVTSLVAGSGITYCPFPGTIVGHPSELRGEIHEIVDSARKLAAVSGVDGLDLLAYRYDGDVPSLVNSVVEAVDVPVIAAGGIKSAEQIHVLAEAGVWGITIGGAVFKGKLPAPDTTVRSQVEWALDAVAAAS